MTKVIGVRFRQAGKVYFFSQKEVKYGKYYQIKINKATDYDLYGERL